MSREVVYVPKNVAETMADAGVETDLFVATALAQFARLDFRTRRSLVTDFLWGDEEAREPLAVGRLALAALGKTGGLPRRNAVLAALWVFCQLGREDMLSLLRG